MAFLVMKTCEKVLDFKGWPSSYHTCSLWSTWSLSLHSSFSVHEVLAPDDGWQTGFACLWG